MGCSLEALLYCYYNNIPFVYNNLEYPNRFEYFNNDIDLSRFILKNEPRVLVSPSSEKKVGINKSWLWERLYFYLSMGGLNPLADKVASLRVEGTTLKTFTHNARSAEIKFQKLIVFNAEGIFGLPSPIEIPKKKYKIYDWMKVRSGLKHPFDWIEDASPFVKCIHFYPTDRIDGDQVYKDACAVSYLSQEELDDFEYSDINARFKVLHMMKQAGIKGPRNGTHPKDKTKQLYRGLKIETSHRELELLNPPVYESIANIEFNYDTFDDILNKTPLSESYVTRIFK